MSQNNSNDNSNTVISNPQISAMSQKLPPFWPMNPDIWFAQVEATFAISGISADKTKFYHVIACIDSKYLEVVQDILKSPPENDKYGALKSRMLKEFSISETEKLNKLLQMVDMGDKKPTQLLREMQNLAGTNFGATALETLFLQRLPENIRNIVSASSGSTEEKAKIADKIFELSNNQVHAVNTNPNSEINALRSDIRYLAETLNKISTFPSNRSRGSFRRRSVSRSSSPHPQNNNNNICYYHKRFGAKAIKCTSPCSYKKGN